jgi:putative phage-type endonuclease
MIIHDCLQGSPEWFSLRMGKITGSHFSDVLNKKTGRKTYMYKLIAELGSDAPEETYTNDAMARGTELEPQAREYYEWSSDRKVRTVGFVQLDEWVGVSPDGLVDPDGQIEIKCPNTSTHVSYIDAGRMPTIYIPQVQGNLWVTGRKWCDFISYDPRYKPRPIWIIRVQRDEEYIKNLDKEVKSFIKDMKELQEKIVNPY